MSSATPPAKWGKRGDLLFCSAVFGGVEIHSISFVGVLPLSLAESFVGLHPDAVIEGFSALEMPEEFAWMAESRVTSVSGSEGRVHVRLEPC